MKKTLYTKKIISLESLLSRSVALVFFALSLQSSALAQNGHIIGNNNLLRLESTGTSGWLSFYHNNSYKGYLWAVGNDIILGNQASGRVQLANGTTPGLTLNNNGTVFVNGTTMASGATVEEFNVVGSDMNLEDVNPYLRFVRTGSTSSNVGGLDFKEGSTSEYRLNYHYGSNKLFFSKGIELDGTEDITIDANTGDLDVRRSIFFGSVEGFKDGGTNIIEAINGSIHPTGDNIYSLGASGSRWSSLWAADGTINTSDRRLKKNIHTTSYGLNEVMQMKPVSFEWNDSKRSKGSQMGFVAQDLLEIVPEVVVTTEMVRTSDNGDWMEVPVENLGVKYSNLIPILTKAIQEQQAIITRLEKRIADLELK